MGRYSSESAYNFRLRVAWGGGAYMMSWTVDFYYSDTRGRFPRTFQRVTNRKGAERFAKKHGLKMPEEAKGS